MPLLGWGMLSAAAYPVVLFGGWHLSAILPQSDSVHTLLWDAYFYLAFAFFALILWHVAAALFHALVRRDGVCADQRDETAAVRPRAHSITSSAEQRRWYFEAERLGGSEIELRRRLKLRLKRTYCGHHFPIRPKQAISPLFKAETAMLTASALKSGEMSGAWRGSWLRNSSLRICNPHQLNLKRNADVKATGANHGGCAMLAEIFMIRLEAVARAAKEAANSPRFVPVTLPAAKAS